MCNSVSAHIAVHHPVEVRQNTVRLASFDVASSGATVTNVQRCSKDRNAAEDDARSDAAASSFGTKFVFSLSPLNPYTAADSRQSCPNGASLRNPPPPPPLPSVSHVNPRMEPRRLEEHTRAHREPETTVDGFAD